MLKENVIVWWIVLQWITKFAVFVIDGGAIFSTFLKWFLILFLGVFRIGLLVVVNRKWENFLLRWLDLCCRRHGMYSAPYKQSAPNNSLTVNRANSQPGPTHSRWIWLISDSQAWIKHRVAIYRPKWKWPVYKNLTECIGTGITWQQVHLAWKKHRLTTIQQ